MTKLSKNYRAAIEKIGEEAYAPLAAMNLVKEVSTAKFDETVTVDFRLGIDTRQADQQLRGTVSLPNGSGKTVRVAVFAEGEAARAALDAQLLLDEDGRRRGLAHERERLVLVDRDLDRDDGAGLVLRLGVERLAELHDVDALGAERRADRRSRVRGTRGDLQLDKAGLLLFSHDNYPFS